MPSPLRKKEVATIAYTRWEAVDAEEEEQLEESAQIHVPFHEFQEERVARGRRLPVPYLRPKSEYILRGSGKAWSNAVKVLLILVSLGVGWILGFLVRWGVHHFYVDPLGHCTTPKVYTYNDMKAAYAIDEVNITRIGTFFKEFTAESESHGVGTAESGRYADYIVDSWKGFGLDSVEMDRAKVSVPSKSSISKKIVIADGATGNVEKTIELDRHNSADVAYSARAVGEGRLVYGHLGRMEDFRLLKANVSFSGCVVVLKVNNQHDTGSMVRNAQSVGATAVVIFPDPDVLGDDFSPDLSISRSVKFFPGDPFSPYNPSELSMPKIPVVSVSYEVALDLLGNYTDSLGARFNGLLPLSSGGGGGGVSRNYTAKIEVDDDVQSAILRNVIGTIRGRFEPTRYIVVGSHHDTWSGVGASKAGMGHSALMELVRVFAKMKGFGWMPGRSIIFASWDGEELGRLGSMSWLHKHSKELSSRAVAYINLDYEMRDMRKSKANKHISASPMIKTVVDLAAKSIPCSWALRDQEEESHNCTLLSKWAGELSSTTLPSQNMFGISSVDIALENDNDDDDDEQDNDDGDVKARQMFRSTLTGAVQRLLASKFRYSSQVVKFVVVLLMQLSASSVVPFEAADYAAKIRSDMGAFFDAHGDALAARNLDATSQIGEAVKRFSLSAKNFHSTFDASATSMQFLADHEFSDQLLELERAFLLPSFTWNPLMEFFYPDRHVIYGPSPLNAARTALFPRLGASLVLANASGSDDADDGSGLNESYLEAVKKELFYVVDALEAASCVMDNHLLHAGGGN